MDAQLNKEFERRAGSLIEDCEYSAFILCNPALDEFVMTSEVPEGEYASALRTRGMVFLGVIGVANGCPITTLRVPVDPASIRVISDAYLKAIRENFTEKGDGLDWLSQLHNLPDTRQEEN